MITHGSARRPWIGVTGLTITREVAFHYGSPFDRRVFVAKVVPGSHVETAGRASSDMVLEFAGKTTNNIEKLVKEIKKKKAEEKVEILILRNFKRLIVKAVLERTPRPKAEVYLRFV